jgi:hypothetical protein
MNYEEGHRQIRTLPAGVRDRIGYGNYNNYEQFYIKGVDGTLAELGSYLPTDLADTIRRADAAHKRLVKEHDNQIKPKKL